MGVAFKKSNLKIASAKKNIVNAKQIGVSPSTVHRRKEEIIKKLKKYLK